MQAKNGIKRAFLLSTVSLVAACGGGGGTDNTTQLPAQYSISGAVTGLTATGLVLQDGNGNAVTLDQGTGNFAFKSGSSYLPSGQTYAVTVAAQPSGLTCSVSNGAGTVSANVTGIQISCASGGQGSASASQGSAAECYNPVLDKPGTTTQFDYRIVSSNPAMNGTMTAKGSLSGNASFNGQTGLLLSTINLTMVYAGGTAQVSTQETYGKTELTIDGPVGYLYGGTFKMLSSPSGVLSQTDRFNPAAVDRIFILKKDETYTYTETGTTTNDRGQVSNHNRSEDRTYLGQTKVTVPAGEFDACRFRIFDRNLNSTTEQYASKNSGAIVLITATDPANQSLSIRTELQASSHINGVPIRP